MFTENFAEKAKQKLVSELENNIPENGSFEEIICSEILPDGLYIDFSISSMKPKNGVIISVTAKKDGRINTKYLFRGTKKEALDWFSGIGKEELAEKTEKTIDECKSFYYP